MKSVVVKVIWEKQDTFDTIRKKLIALEGRQVLNKDKDGEPFTIFDVGEVEQMNLEHWLGDDYELVPMWGFPCEYGQEDSLGNRWCRDYNIMIPRESDYESDVKKNPIVIDDWNPFIFYNL
jgi:hypothetical protein